jgi:N-acetylneuraminic acid mutarotase/PKD repeat protein
VSWTYNNKLYLFGGLSNKFFTWNGDFADSLLSDIWEFDLSTKKWRWIKGSNSFHQNGVYGTQGTAATGNTPGARSDALFWQANDKFYLFGGRGRAENGSIGCLNDLWEFDPATNNWRWLKGSKLVNQFSTFGTMGTAGANNTPGGRVEGTCWTLNNKLYTFLGRGIEPGNSFANPQLLHELWVYDITTNNWTWLKGNNSSQDYLVDNYANFGVKGVASAATRPNVSYNPTGSVVDGKLYLFGGRTSYQYTGCTNCYDGTYNNLWSYDPATNYWTWVEGGRNNPVTTSYPDTPVAPAIIWPGTKNNCSSNLSWTYGNSFYIFGGNNYGSNNEVWRYNLCNTPTVCNNTTPQVSLGNDTTICSGSYKELNAGNFGSSYLWSTGDTSQSIAVTQSGTYWVHVTNPANLSADDTITVNFSAAPTIPFSGNLTICPGMPYTLNALNPGCIYLWNTGATTSSIIVDTTGNYSVNIVNGNGCSVSAAMDIWVAPQPVAYLGPDTGDCSYTPGFPERAIYPVYVPGDSYLWNNGDTSSVIFVTQTGAYSLQITNEYGCIDRDTVLITFDTPIDFSLGNDTAICSSMPLTLNAAHPYCSYFWSDNSTDSVLIVDQAGYYSVYLTTQYGCETFDDINITLLPMPAASNIQTQVNGNTVDFSAVNAQNITDYTWYFGDNTSSAGATPSHTYNQPGSYNIQLVVHNLCGTDTLSGTVSIQPGTGINESFKDSDLSVFPNPAKELINIQSKNSPILRVTFYNILGQIIFDSKEINAMQFTLNVRSAKPGIYQLNVDTKYGSYSKKLSITK